MERAYVRYYSSQVGRGINDIGPLLQFYPTIQRGRGIGNIFGSLFRYLKPVLSSGWDLFKKEAVNTSKNILGDIASGAHIKEAVIDQGKSGIKNLRKSMVNQLHSMYGGRRKSIKRRSVPKKQHSELKRRKKRTKKSDIFS